MDVKEYLNLVAYEKKETPYPDNVEYTVYRSKFDDSYITMKGLENNVRFLADREITEELTSGVGFSPKYNKWYGWSHRGIMGFTVGSVCKMGDCHYNPATEQEELADSIRFWSDYNKKKVKAKIIRPGLIEISYEYRSNIESFFKYWFNYPAIPFKYKLKLFIKYDLLLWITDYKFNGQRIKRIFRRLKWQFLQKNKRQKVFSEYDPNEFGRGEWRAMTMACAKQMAIDFNRGIA